MPRKKRTVFSQIIIFAMLSSGIGIVAVSAFYASSFLAILGSVLIFWGAIFLYVTPSKQVLLTLLNASDEATSANIERLISELNLSEKGVYLPPENLKNTESSLVFIPKNLKTPLPTSEEANEKLFTNEKTGAFVSPPGSALLSLFERQLGFSFTKTDLNQVQTKLPKLLVEDLELAENAEIQIQGNAVTMKITGSIFDEIYRQTDSQPKTRMQVGCLLSSAIACALAKAAGKPVTIQNETHNKETKTTCTEYQMFEYPTFDYPIFENQIFEGKTLQLPPLTSSDARTNCTEVKSSMSGNSDLNIDPHALNYLKKNGNVFILTDVENPQYSYNIKGCDADSNLIFKFEEFVEVCKTSHYSKTNMKDPRTEFSTKIFDLASPANSKHYDLGFYVAKSGFPTIDDWLKALKTADEIPEHSTGHNKIFYLYSIQRELPNT